MDAVSNVNNSQILGLAFVEFRANPHQNSCSIGFHIIHFFMLLSALSYFLSFFCPFCRHSQLSIKCNFCVHFSYMLKIWNSIIRNKHHLKSWLKQIINGVFRSLKMIGDWLSEKIQGPVCYLSSILNTGTVTPIVHS